MWCELCPVIRCYGAWERLDADLGSPCEKGHADLITDRVVLQVLPPLPAEVPDRGAVVPPQEPCLVETLAFGAFGVAVCGLLLCQVFEWCTLGPAALLDLCVDAIAKAVAEQRYAGRVDDQSHRKLRQLQASVEPENVLVFAEEFEAQDLVPPRGDTRISIAPERRLELPSRLPRWRVVGEADVVDSVVHDRLGDFVAATELGCVNQNSIHEG